MKSIRVAARNSPLSHAQTKEVLEELRQYHPYVCFECFYTETEGDLDKKTSLRTLGKSDFFTREVDEMVLSGVCQIAIHSAKDLPDPIPKGLRCIVLTKGVNSGDSLVLREGENLDSLPPQAIIATSSERREEAVKKMRSDLKFVDIRGLIDERLDKLQNKEVDGVVIAEAALIRLGYTHLNRITIPGPTTPLQGQLAIIARENDHEAAELFFKLNAKRAAIPAEKLNSPRMGLNMIAQGKETPVGVTQPWEVGIAAKRVLYMGPEVPLQVPSNVMMIHCPLIRIIPRPISSEDIQTSFAELFDYTHLIFTSKTAVRIFCQYLSFLGKEKEHVLNKMIIAIGKSTAKEIENHGVNCKINVPSLETAEGVIEVLEKQSVENYYFWPHAAEARNVISDYFKEKAIRYRECILYDTVTEKPSEPPDFSNLDEICFTSPSTVRAFLDIFGSFPKNKTLSSWGPITEDYLSKILARLG